MKVLTGHLTASDKQAIKAILSDGLMTGKVGRKSFFITKGCDFYTVKIQVKDRGIGLIGSPLRLSLYTHTITI